MPDRLVSCIAGGWAAVRACFLRARVKAWRSRGARPESRSLRLLRTWLSAEQRSQFDSDRCFEVIGCDTGKRYRIHYGVATNVHELDAAGVPKLGWCFAPEGYLAPGDVMLAQKIALETGEREALAIANSLPMRR
jgi:hypothetical protein